MLRILGCLIFNANSIYLGCVRAGITPLGIWRAGPQKQWRVDDVELSIHAKNNRAWADFLRADVSIRVDASPLTFPDVILNVFPSKKRPSLSAIMLGVPCD
jgi:hypothetical protein